MKISSNDRRIIGHVEFHPFATAPEIARALKMKPHQVAYSLRRLIDGRVLKLAPVIDLWRLGYQDIGLFFSLLPGSKDKRDRVIKSVLQLPGLAWLGSFIGQFEFGAVLFCKHPAEVSAHLGVLESKVGAQISSWSVAPRVSFLNFNRGYLLGGSSHLAYSFTYSGELQQNVSSGDATTLQALANIEFSSFRDLSRKIGIPNSTLEERKTSLQKRKILRGFHYLVDSNALGVQAIKLLLTTQGKSLLVQKALIEFAKHAGNITEIAQVFGRWDYEVTAELSDVRKLSDLIGGLHLATKGQISNVEILTYLDDLHFSLYPFRSDRK